ncbi:heavy metal-associated isoprenylated plant protein 28-like isoform X1 [Macadamia integrifolia]|uniref:heavy metal-associated isoprenylated plant protein 28-like isoform X1 n=1 Tax=Macadamia integrifolia TaxID=60698 RepID=UPI001C4F068E|nr:heavy metal-associated isoprenylated plant protein 28-like isoform X1 [Macadamia integrifolia]
MDIGYPFSLEVFLMRMKNMQTVELKVEMVGIHEKRLRKCLSKVKGIEKVEVDVSSQKVMVTGYTHRNKVLKALRRGGLKAEFWSAQNELLNAYASATYGSLRINNFNLF